VAAADSAETLVCVCTEEEIARRCSNAVGANLKHAGSASPVIEGAVKPVYDSLLCTNPRNKLTSFTPL